MLQRSNLQHHLWVCGPHTVAWPCIHGPPNSAVLFNRFLVFDPLSRIKSLQCRTLQHQLELELAVAEEGLPCSDVMQRGSDLQG